MGNSVLNTFRINKMLQIGIRDAFRVGVADFSGMTDDPDGLFVSEVAQKAIIEVDELGTVASAATRVCKCLIFF